MVNYIYHFKTCLLYTHDSLRKAHVHNTNHVFTYIRDAAHITVTPHTLWHESSNANVPHTNLHSHYESTVVCQVT